MFQVVRALDAKAKLSGMLRAVREGQRYTITVQGEPVADLVPTETGARHDAHAVSAAKMLTTGLPRGADDERQLIFRLPLRPDLLSW